MRTIEEVLEQGAVPLWRHPEWALRFPWLLQGTTAAYVPGSDEAIDFGLFGASPVGEALARWRALRASTGMRATVHARQVHEAEVARWPAVPPTGFVLVDGCDAHVSDAAGALLTVSIADCVPVFLTVEEPRAIAMIHAGWRGVAAGVLESALAQLLELSGSDPEAVWMHCGPSICGRCYEVGPEVHAGVEPGSPPPPGKLPIDLPAALGRRAAARGLRDERLTLSAHCTRCGPGRFHSHRGGSPARQLGVLGIRP